MKNQNYRMMHRLNSTSGLSVCMALLVMLMMIACGLSTATPADVAQGTPTTVAVAESTNTPSPTPTPEPQPTATIQPNLAGLVLDQTTRQPLVGAEVKVGEYTATTDAEGRYTLADVPAGQYVLSAVHDGYDPGLSSIFNVVTGQPLSLDLALYPAETAPYPQDPMLTNPVDPNGAPTAEDAERLARLQGLTGEVKNVNETKLSGSFLVNYKIDNEIRAAVAELRHEAWALTDETGQEWQIIKVCGNLARWTGPDAIIPTPQPQNLPLLAEVVGAEIGARTCAAETCAEIEVLRPGTRVEVLRCWVDDGWCQIVLPGGDKGWVPGQSLQHLALAEAVPRLAAGGGRIAFLSDRDRESDWADIYLMNPDGSDLTRLTNNLPLVSSMANSLWDLEGYFTWSSIHQKFFYAEKRNLYSLNADGSGETQIAEGVGRFSLSPDGLYITYEPLAEAMRSPGTSFDIAIMKVDDTNQTILTNKETREQLGVVPDAWLLAPTWSPDGSQIAFYAGGSLAVMSADGTNPMLLTPESEGVQEPFTWSPDGQYISFAGSSDYDFVNVNDKTLFSFDVKGKDFVWSPDGSKIAFYKLGPMGYPPGGTPPPPDISEGEWQIWMMNADGSGLTQLTFEGHNCCPVWVD